MFEAKDFPNAENKVASERDRGPWMSTYTQGRWYLLDPRACEVKIEDIAHALSMICRYGGHCSFFYSVAEHSVHAAWNVWQETNDQRLALSTLLHDAEEAYIGDLTLPLKRALHQLVEGAMNSCGHAVDRTKCWHAFKALTYMTRNKIERAFRLDFSDPAVKNADLRMLRSEAYPLLRARFESEGGDWADLGVEPYPDFQPGFWPPELAEKRFLGLFNKLTAEQPR